MAVPSIFVAVVRWWFTRLAKQHPEENTKQIVEDFLKENGIDAKIVINDNNTAIMMAEEKERVINKLDRMSESKKRQILDNIQRKSGFTMDEIQTEIHVQNNIAMGLHEAGHAIDFQNNYKGKMLLKKILPKASKTVTFYGDFARAINDVRNANPAIDIPALPGKNLYKLKGPILLAGAAPELIQEAKASIAAYKHMENKFGKNKANKAVKQVYAPAFASYLSANVVEPMMWDRITNAISAVIGKKIAQNIKIADLNDALCAFEKVANQTEPEEFDKICLEILESLRE